MVCGGHWHWLVMEPWGGGVWVGVMYPVCGGLGWGREKEGEVCCEGSGEVLGAGYCGLESGADLGEIVVGLEIGGNASGALLA
jgi:hypothetical protein